MNIEEIKALAGKQRLTKAEKSAILAACDELGIVIKNKNCSSCYRDALLALYRVAIKEPEGLQAICHEGWRVKKQYAEGFSVNGQAMNAAVFSVKALEVAGVLTKICEKCE